MKQFSLDEYLKNPTRPIVTRDGRSVRIICTDRKSDAPATTTAMTTDVRRNMSTRTSAMNA